MTQILALPDLSIGLPLAVLFGSLIVSRVLRVSTIGTLVAASAPLALPFLDLPFAKEFSDGHPEYIIGGAWAVLLALAIGWVLVRPIVSGAVASFGVVRLAYLCVLATAILVVSLLFIDPKVLSTHAPGWRGSAGLVLLSASLLSMSFALARVLRAAMLLVVWSFVSVVLASELFLHKLPQEIVRDDLKRIESLIPSGTLQKAIEQLDVRAPRDESGIRAFILGGSSATGLPFAEEKALSSKVRDLFEKAGLKATVHDASVPGASVYDIGRIAREKIEAQHPDVVFVVGWESDKERGVNSLGLPGLSESEAQALQTSQREGGGANAVVEVARAAVTSSAIYRYVMSQVRGEEVELQKPRVSPQEYREQLAQTVKSLQSSGATVVLISEPVVGPEDQPYREAMVETAVSEKALFVPSDTLMTQANDPLVFGRGSLLSDRGYEVLAKGAVDLVSISSPAIERSSVHSEGGQGA